MFKSFLTISFFISLSRILGFVRDVLIARYIGVSVLSDAFFGAFRVPNFFRRIFAEGAFNSAFVPMFIEKINANDEHNKIEKSRIFLTNIFSILLFSLLVFVIFFQIFMPFLMKILFPGFFNDPEKSSYLISFSRITIFYLIFISLVSLFSGILNSINKFAVPASSPIILNSTLIIFVLFFGKLFPNYGYALSWGVFVAGVLQLFFISISIYKNGYMVLPRVPKVNQDVRNFFRKLVPGLIGGNVMQINLLVDSIFASPIIGAVSYLYYADRINQLPLAMIGVALSVALLPTLSRYIKNNEIDSAISLQNKALEISLILVLPATLALTILSYPIISTLFEGGSFGANESFFVSKALMYYSFGLPAFVLVKIMEPTFFSRGDTKTPMKIAIICLINNVILNYVFHILEMGFVGIILASIVSSYLNLSMLFFNAKRKKLFYFEKKFIKKFILILIPTFLMALSLFCLKELFAVSSYLHKIIELSIMIFVGLIVYGLGCFYTGGLDLVLKFIKPKKNTKLGNAKVAKN